MINLFPDPEKERLRKKEIERISALVKKGLGSKAEHYQIKVMQLDHCPDPVCEKLETLILLLGEVKSEDPSQNKEEPGLQFCSPERILPPAEHPLQKKEGTRLQFRFTCSLVELTEEKMAEFLKDLKNL